MQIIFDSPVGIREMHDVNLSKMPADGTGMRELVDAFADRVEQSMNGERPSVVYTSECGHPFPCITWNV